MFRKTFLSTLFILHLLLWFAPSLRGQCPGGYTTSQLNWDNLDYYFNSGLNVAPYGYRVSSTNYTYVSDAMEQSQKFAIGTTSLTIATSNAALINPGAGASAENATHTGNLANYNGEDVQYNPSADGQTITITFTTAVSDPNFTLYDIDASAVFTITALNNLNANTLVNAAFQGVTNLTAGGVFPAPRTVTANATAIANNLNSGSATITVPGLVNSITITITTRGADAVFWMSDMNACVSGTFPTNWHQGANNRPFWGPTQTQPDYFLLTPDNNSAYMVDPATGIARVLFTDAAKTFINSFGYDPYNRFLYYITENSSVDYTNKQIKRYDYNTETSSVIIADISTLLNVPTFFAGVESAGCSFYNGALYFGVEGGSHNNSGTYTTRETIIWKIDFDVSNNPLRASQVYATNAAISGGAGTSIHDWGDFMIKNGIIYNFNTARNGTNYTQSKYHHFDMMSGAVTNVYNNPGTTAWNGQSGMTWNQGLYYFRDNGPGVSVIGLYNEAGVNGATTTITVASGPAWPGNSGDASDPFRPKCDFGDAPASYDPYVTPATQSPAVHERTDNIRMGSTWDYEFLKRGVSGTDDVDDGIPSLFIMAPGGGGYVVQGRAYNNSGSPATLIAWLDYNGNGLFDASEAITPITVPSSASLQNYWLYWPNTPNTFVNGQSTYLRVRITAQSAGMTTSHATGYFTSGEVEDYRVLIDNFPLATRLIDFDATLQNKKVELNWHTAEEPGIFEYQVEKSSDNINWTKIHTVTANGRSGRFSYQEEDANPFKGVSYYRLRIIESSGMNRFSPVKIISLKEPEISFTLSPNPAKDHTKLLIETAAGGEATIHVITMQGKIILSTTKRINSGSNPVDLPLPETFPGGMYIVRITFGDKMIYKKLIVNK